jgi:glycogen debranching enzyme
MTSQSDQLPGLEPRPAHDISRLTVLRNEGVSLLCSAAGDFNSAQDPGAGLYHRDTRYLSRFEMLLGNSRMVMLDSQERGFWLTSTLTNPDLLDTYARVVAGQSVVIRRQSVIDGGLAVTVRITNYGKFPLAAPLQLIFGADFEDIFVIRGFARRSVKPSVSSRLGHGEVVHVYTGLDHVIRTLRMTFSEAPAQLEPGWAQFDLNLAPGESRELVVSALIDDAAAPTHPEELVQRGVHERRTWREALTSFESNNPRLDSLFQRCLDDLYSLRTRLGGRHFLAAGVPWFDALFGRDSVIAGIASLGLSPEILRDSLTLLAKEQATETDPGRDAEPGKIPHELRFGELANLGEVPFGRYFGSIDATPLFVLGCGEYHRWTGDLETVRSLLPAARRAIEWCLKKAHDHPLGALAYDRQSVNGLEHQGWKDSEAGICHSDGSAVSAPVALVEVQAYLAAALKAYAHLCSLAGEQPGIDTAAHLGAGLALLSERFVVDGKAALALDGTGQPVWTRASNAGHVLWAGACAQDDARKLAGQLMQPDMFSGWGIRTLARGVPAYNPLGYHVGSIWPHDNAMVLEGMKRYGLLDNVERLGSGLLDAMMGFPDGRVPELFSGEDRGGQQHPTPYPVASRPQAWSAASLPWTLMTMLGITPANSEFLHIVRPALPSWLGWARLRNIRFGSTTVDLFFRREHGHTSVEVERQSGPGSVVLSPNWPHPPLVVGQPSDSAVQARD